MELDLKKKIIIGVIIVTVLGILVYLYYDYINSNQENINISVEGNNASDFKKMEDDIGDYIEEDDDKIIIIHITGEIKNPRNCKNERRR